MRKAMLFGLLVNALDLHGLLAVGIVGRDVALLHRARVQQVLPPAFAEGGGQQRRGELVGLVVIGRWCHAPRVATLPRA